MVRSAERPGRDISVVVVESVRGAQKVGRYVARNCRATELTTMT